MTPLEEDMCNRLRDKGFILHCLSLMQSFLILIMALLLYFKYYIASIVFLILWMVCGLIMIRYLLLYYALKRSISESTGVLHFLKAYGRGRPLNRDMPPRFEWESIVCTGKDEFDQPFISEEGEIKGNEKESSI